MTIEEIYDIEGISVRSYNLCKYNNLDTIEKLLDYYMANYTFENLRNCGRKSNEELIGISKKYRDYYTNKDLNKSKENPLEKVLISLNRIQREVINSYITVNANNLSIRNRNAILKFLNDNLSVRNFAEKILLDKNLKVSKISNVGDKSVPELEIFISIIKDFILEISECKEEKQLISIKNKFLIQRTFSISNIPSKILESESIFQLTEFLITNNAFFNENYTSIFKKATKIYQNNKEKTTEEIASENNLSRERVRQIRKECLSELFEKLSFIKNFNDDLFKNYGMDISSNLIEVKEDLVNQINKLNNTNFSKEFISYILAVYLSDDYFFIGNIEDILYPKYFNNRYRHNWNNFYIVNKCISRVDFISFADDIKLRINERINETYCFNFKSYLSRFVKNIDVSLIDLALPIAEKILNDEFGLYLDLNDNLVFKRNTNKNAFEYALEALEHLGRPSKAGDIYKKIIELYPYYETDEEKVRASMKRKDGFVPVGRDRVFGLKKWESELEDFKGGTIRSISIEFLEQFSEPKHISDISEYVLKYRPNTNEKSIYYNLKIDESETFSFYINSLVGLKKKKYPENFILLNSSNLIERNSWEDRYESLQKFLLLEKRLPFSNGVPDEEIKLYRWLSVQKRKVKLKELDSEKSKLIVEILENSPQIISEKHKKVLDKYEELIEFVESNHRLPSVNKLGEENLYQFFYKQRKLLDNDELNNNEKSYFYKVYNILKNK